MGEGTIKKISCQNVIFGTIFLADFTVMFPKIRWGSLRTVEQEHNLQGSRVQEGPLA